MTTYTSNTTLFDKLAGGGHPLRLISELGLSLAEHLDLLSTDKEYEQLFTRSMMSCVAGWRELQAKAFEDGVSRSLNSRMYDSKIQDLEQYLPGMEAIKTRNATDNLADAITEVAWTVTDVY